MSTLIVDVCAIEEIKAHPKADRLELARAKNWWCVVPKDKYQPGHKVVYVPPDSVLPPDLAERWGIAKYCVPLGADITGERPPGLRVRASRFRQMPSFGTIQDPDDPTWEIGLDVRDYYGITKYEPPLKANDGDAAPDVPAFHKYTGIENLGNFPGILQDGEEVVITEKLHGTNCRVGLVFAPDDDGVGRWVYMAGSHSIRRKEYNEKGQRSLYWMPLAEGNDKFDCPLSKLLQAVLGEKNAGAAVIVFGEVFGAGVQDMSYGQKGKSFRAFDISVDGQFLDYEDKARFCRIAGVEMVPFLYRGPYSFAKVEELVDGPTTICEASAIPEAFKGREGIVITPAVERFDMMLGGPHSGRVILKYISVDYHERRNKDRTEDH